MNKKWILILCFAAIPLSSVFAQETVTTTTTNPPYTVIQPNPWPLVEFEGIYWWPTLGGHIYVNDNSRDTKLNLRSDLGLNDDHGSPGGQLTLNTGPASSIRASYLYLDSTGDNTLSRTIVYDGQTYSDGTYVKSKLQVQYFCLGWLWDFIHEENLNLGLIIDAKGIDTRSSLNAPGTGFSNSYHFIGGAPTPGLSGEIKLINHLSVFAELTGIPAGRYGYFLDGQGGLKLNITRYLALSAGYREIDVKVNYHDDSGSLDLPGPFAALTLKF